MKSISAYESTIWSSLIITVMASIYFFGKVFGALAADAPLDMSATLRLGLAIVIILVAVEVAFRIAMHAWCRGKEPQTDERDALIAAKSARNAYYTLIVCQFLLIGHLAMESMFGREPLLAIHTASLVAFMVFAIVIAEITHFSSRIVYYRIGA